MNPGEVAPAPGAEVTQTGEANTSYSLSRRRWVAFSVVIFCFWASLYVYVPTLAVFARSIGASLTVVGLIVAAYGFVQFILRVPVGYFSDRFGRRAPFILVGLAANVLGALGMGLFASPVLLILWRGVHGVGAASYVTSSVFFAGFFRPENATRATSLMVTLTSASQVIVSLLGGRLADVFGVNSTFWAAAVFGGIGMAVMAFVGDRAVKAHRPMSLRRFGRVASVRGLLVVSALGAINQYLTFGVTMGFVPIYADRLGASNTDLGLLTTIGFLVFGVAALGSAGLAGRVGERAFIVLGSLVTALSIVGLPLVGNLPLLFLAQAANGFGRGMVFPVLMGLSIKTVPEDERASAMGVFQSIYAIGMFAGPASAGLIADWLGLSGLFVAVGSFAFVAALAALLALPQPARSPRARTAV